MTLSPDQLYPYQIEAVNHILNRNGSMLWMDMGLGKTVATLTAIERLLDGFKIKAALVLAPLKVVEAVWEQEAAKWSHTRRLKFSVVRGTPAQRLAALRRPADVYLTNYEQIEWMVGRYITEKYTGRDGRTKSRNVFCPGVLIKEWLDKGKGLPFNMAVFDEVSKVKNSTGKRFRAFAKILTRMTYRVGLTGTPAANGIADLHGQFLMIDGGRRLGPNITGFRDRWMLQSPFDQKWVPRRGATDEIKGLISDITLEMKKEDYLQLPPVIDQDIYLDLPKGAAEQYREFERAFFLELDGGEIEAFNAGAKSTKCRQLANGACYTGEAESGEWSLFHNTKLDAVGEIMEELAGRPLLLFYQFKHDLARLRERFPDAVALDHRDTADRVARWNRGEIELLVCHPQTAGHGLNLQQGGNHLLWFGLPWALESYEQAIARLARNGQKGEVVVNHRLLMRGTIESAVAAALKSKGAGQEALRRAVKEYRKRKGLCYEPSNLTLR